MPRAIAPEVTTTTSSPACMPRGHLLADRGEHVGAHLAGVVGDDARAQLHHQGGHARRLCLAPPGVEPPASFQSPSCFSSWNSRGWRCAVHAQHGDHLALSPSTVVLRISTSREPQAAHGAELLLAGLRVALLGAGGLGDELGAEQLVAELLRVAVVGGVDEVAHHLLGVVASSPPPHAGERERGEREQDGERRGAPADFYRNGAPGWSSKTMPAISTSSPGSNPAASSALITPSERRRSST